MWQWQNWIEAKEVSQGLRQIILTVETLGRWVPFTSEESPLHIRDALHLIATYTTIEPARDSRALLSGWIVFQEESRNLDVEDV